LTESARATARIALPAHATALPHAELDSVEVYERLDPLGMRHQIASLPRQAADAWDLGTHFTLPQHFVTPGQVILLGVGGSAAGPDVITSLADRGLGVPTRLISNYTAPRLGPDALVIATSFSGATEETVASFQAALPSARMALAITTGGPLEQHARQTGIPACTYQWDGPPRAAFSYSLFPALAILTRLQAIDLTPATVDHAIAQLAHDASRLDIAQPRAGNQAKHLASSLADTTPIILAPTLLAPAARRWVGQLAENAKQWSAPCILPEFNHNSLVALAERPEAHDGLRVVLLDTPVAHPRNRLRIEQTASMLEAAGIGYEHVLIEASEPLEAITRACYLGDWVSLYTAMLNDVDPWPVAPIDQLKSALAENE